MKFVLDPPIATKIAKMRSRSRYNHPAIQHLGINQSYMVLEDGRSQDTQFSFLVLGDSGSQSYRNDHPQRRVAEAMAELRQDCRFALHTGDVVYLVGSREQYPSNFIRPYQAFLKGGDNPRMIAYDEMVFRTPILPVLGNHDYYDLPLLFGILSQLTAPLRRLLRSQISVDVGWHGSWKGEAYARAFLDYLQQYEGDRLHQHLAQHYTAQFNQQRCLKYQPGQFTRLPNRYYRFRYGGIDFFALDSNTFKHPLPIPETEAGRESRKQLMKRRHRYLRFKQKLMKSGLLFDSRRDLEGKNFQEIYTKLEQVEEQIRDIDQQLNLETINQTVDQLQLDWLTQELIQSWRDPEAKGRILFFHHPPYVTEATKWNHGETLAVRYHLRRVLDAVEAAVRPAATNWDGTKRRGADRDDTTEKRSQRPLVDLVLSGHAHCLEYLTTGETGHGDRHIPWIVCGGSGFSLRRQRREGTKLMEGNIPVATSHVFVGRTGRGSDKRRPYSFLKIDINTARECPMVTIYPQIVERFKGQWRRYEQEPIHIAH